MGFGDKLKGLKDQAQQAVAENKDKIQGAVQVVGEAANTKTHGKYATKIMKVGEKVEASVDKFAADTQEPGEEGTTGVAPDAAVNADAGAPQETATEAPSFHEPVDPVTPPPAPDAPAAGFPDFE